MLHPVDYRLSKNKFWLSTWNSYSLKNYRNLILNDKILNILGYIFKNCFKSSYSFASPWSNPRKNRKYFPNFVIGFDGRRAIRTGPNKVKKLPGFIIPEDYHIIRFSNFIVLKIYFLIDKNLETYWAKKQKNWRSPIKYLNMRYNKKKNKDNSLRFSKNLFNSNIEKKNFKSTGFFMYLINLLNNNYIRKSMYFNFSEKNDCFKKDRRHTLFRFYYDNFKLLNKVRNNYFLLYLSDNRSNKNYNNANLFDNKDIFSNLSFKNANFYKRNINKSNKLVKKSSFNYNSLSNYSKNYDINSSKTAVNIFKSLSNNNLKLFNNFNNNLSEKTFENNKLLKAFTTFNLISKNSEKNAFPFFSNNNSLKSSLIKRNNINRLLNKVNLNLLSYDLNSNLNNSNLNKDKKKTIIKNFKFWSSNIYSISKNINILKLNDLKLSNSNSTNNNYNSKNKLNKFYISLNKRRSPLLFFQGFTNANKTNIVKKKTIISLNKHFNLHNFRLFNRNIKSYSFSNRSLLNQYSEYKNLSTKYNLNSYSKSKNFWELFILSNRLINLGKNFQNSNNFNFEKNHLIFSKNVKNLNNNKYSTKYFNKLLEPKLKKLEKNILFSYSKKNFVINNKLEYQTSLNLGLNKINLNLKKNKWLNLYKVLNINKLNKKKSEFSLKSSKSAHFFSFVNSLSSIDSIDSLNNENNLFLKNKLRNLLSNKGSNSLLKNTSKNTKPFLSRKNSKNTNFNFSNRFMLGKTLLSTSNFNKKKNYNYRFLEYWNFLPLKSKNLLDKNNLEKNIKNSLLEFDPFLNTMSLNTRGFNKNKNFNINFTNSLYFNYDKNQKNSILTRFKDNSINNNNNNKISRNLLNSKWNFSKDFKIDKLFNLYYKKTFSRSLQKQDAHSKDDIFQIELRLNYNKVKKSSKLLKFKPYSMRSVSRVQRFKNHNSILTNYVKQLVKQNYLYDFYDLMENKKHVFKKNLSRKSFKLWEQNMLKGKGSSLLSNVSNSDFNYFKVINYSFNPFFEKLNWLKFFNKNIKKIESDPFKDLKKNNKKYLLKNLDLSKLNYKYNQAIKKVQFRYFKRKRWSTKFDNGLFINDVIVKPYKALLFSKNDYDSLLLNNSNNYSNNLFKLFHNKTYRKVNYRSNYNNNIYNYKMFNYKYLWNNKVTEMSKFFLKVNKNKMSSFVSFVFRKNVDINKKLVFNKSSNLAFNKYIQSRLSNVFLSIKDIEKPKKNSRIKKEDLDLRIYGLGSKLSSPRINFNEKKKRMNKLQPKSFLYWNHLKWFNLHVKSKFNSKVSKYDNFYESFKLYESFKRLNFNYYKNKKRSINIINKKTHSLNNLNYNKLNNLVYYTTLLKSKRSFLDLKNSNFLHKKKLLLNWVHDLRFLTSRSKRLGYIPHIRYKALKDSIYMWRINSRKLNLLTRYFKARSKFYKNKLNFVSKNLAKSSIISYLRLMESNFVRIRKSMQRDLPLISTKRYLKLQLRKLNSYIKVLLKRKKRRYFLRSRRKNRSNSVQKLKWKKFYDDQLKKEKELLPKKLFNFAKKRFHIEKKNLIDYVKKFIEHLFLVVFKLDNLRVFYIKKYQMNVMGTKAKLFKNLFNYRLATGFKVPFLVKVICKKLNHDKSLVGCKIGFFGRYSKKLRNRKIWRYVRHIKPSVISTPLDYYNVLILQKWGITGIKLSMLRKKTFNFIFN